MSINSENDVWKICVNNDNGEKMKNSQRNSEHYELLVSSVARSSPALPLFPQLLYTKQTTKASKLSSFSLGRQLIVWRYLLWVILTPSNILLFLSQFFLDFSLFPLRLSTQSHIERFSLFDIRNSPRFSQFRAIYENIIFLFVTLKKQTTFSLHFSEFL